MEEKLKSSTKFLMEIIEEWENVFARETNKLLLKAFIHFVKDCGELLSINIFL